MADRREATGRAQSAWWVESQPEHIGRLLSCSTEDFLTASQSAIEELVRATKSASQSGLLITARMVGALGPRRCLSSRPFLYAIDGCS